MKTKAERDFCRPLLVFLKERVENGPLLTESCAGGIKANTGMTVDEFSKHIREKPGRCFPIIWLDTVVEEALKNFVPFWNPGVNGLERRSILEIKIAISDTETFLAIFDEVDGVKKPEQDWMGDPEDDTKFSSKFEECVKTVEKTLASNDAKSPRFDTSLVAGRIVTALARECNLAPRE
jgi:hypothetical protein